MADEVIINLETLYAGSAKISDIDAYEEDVRQLAGNGNDIVLTGQAPVWLYLKVAHALHGKARSLVYRSPVTGDVDIFDHNPFD